MDKKEMFENNIVSEIKNLIISDSELTYGERNSFDRFILKIDKGISFEEAVVPLLRNLDRLKKGEIQTQGLSYNANKIFIALYGKYDIPLKNNNFLVVTGSGVGRKLTNKELLETTIFLIIVILAYFLYHIYLE